MERGLNLPGRPSAEQRFEAERFEAEHAASLWQVRGRKARRHSGMGAARSHSSRTLEASCTSTASGAIISCSVRWSNGDAHEGEFGACMERHGYGTQRWADGTTYVGFWRHDQMSAEDEHPLWRFSSSPEMRAERVRMERRLSRRCGKTASTNARQPFASRALAPRATALSMAMAAARSLRGRGAARCRTSTATSLRASGKLALSVAAAASCRTPMAMCTAVNGLKASAEAMALGRLARADGDVQEGRWERDEFRGEYMRPGMWSVRMRWPDLRQPGLTYGETRTRRRHRLCAKRARGVGRG
ncbi:hypothetical protein OAO87_00825 [bacterium]|nr:hypothetical protein [bacterium]